MNKWSILIKKRKKRDLWTKIRMNKGKIFHRNWKREVQYHIKNRNKDGNRNKNENKNKTVIEIEMILGIKMELEVLE